MKRQRQQSPRHNVGTNVEQTATKPKLYIIYIYIFFFSSDAARFYPHIPRVGEHTVPPEWLSCMRMDPARAAHSAIRGVLAVPVMV